MGTHLVNFADMRDKWRKKRVRRLKQAQKDARSLEVIDSPRNTADSTLTSRTMHPLPPPRLFHHLEAADQARWGGRRKLPRRGMLQRRSPPCFLCPLRAKGSSVARRGPGDGGSDP